MMRAFIAARDRVCGFPGCHRPAAQCDCDHVVTFAHHGKTIRVNLGSWMYQTATNAALAGYREAEGCARRLAELTRPMTEAHEPEPPPRNSGTPEPRNP